MSVLPRLQVGSWSTFAGPAVPTGGTFTGPSKTVDEGRVTVTWRASGAVTVSLVGTNTIPVGSGAGGDVRLTVPNGRYAFTVENTSGAPLASFEVSMAAAVRFGDLLGNITDTGGQVFNVKAYGATGDGVTDDTAAIQLAIDACAEAGGGVVFVPAGIFIVSASLTLHNGVHVIGVGAPASTVRASADFPAGAVFIRTSASASDSVEHISVERLTVDCVAGPTGSVDGIAIDTSVSALVVYRDVNIDRVEVVNARLGVRSDGNNASAGPMNNQRTVSGSIFRNCGIGVIATGTYRQQVLDSEFYGCTIAGVGTGGITPGAPTVNGPGPTTLTLISRCHVEGLGNISGSGTETESGIYVGASDLVISNCVVSNVSRFGVAAMSGEGYAALVDGVVVWGSGFSGIYLGGGSSGQNGICSNCSLYNVAQSSQDNVAEASAILHGSGNWDVHDIWIPTASEAPSYAIAIGGDLADSYNWLRFTRVNCPTPKTGHTYMLNPSTGIVRFSDCYGVNPTANISPLTGNPITPAVPASTDMVTNTCGADVMVYVTGGSGGQVYIDSVYTGVAEGSFFLGAGSTIQLYNYTTEPTWVWVGR